MIPDPSQNGTPNRGVIDFGIPIPQGSAVMAKNCGKEVVDINVINLGINEIDMALG